MYSICPLSPKYYHLMNPTKLWLLNHLPRDAHKSRKTWSIKQFLSRQAIFCTWHTGCFLWQRTQALVSPNDFLSFALFSPCACSFLTVHHHEGPIGDALLLLRQQNNREPSFSLSFFRGSQGKKLFCEFDHSDSIAFGVFCQPSRPKVQPES